MDDEARLSRVVEQALHYLQLLETSVSVLMQLRDDDSPEQELVDAITDLRTYIVEG